MNRIKDAEVLSVENIFKDKYVIPLYQRNFSWGEEQITRLLQDIYESMKAEDKYFYIGSLIVLQRPNGEFEVIDGQQRLTMLSILSCVLTMNLPLCLRYDSRPEVEDFFRMLHLGEMPKNRKENVISHFCDAIDIINSTQLNMNDSKEKITIDSIDTRENMTKYIRENVCLVREIMPADTDVASYFEIMNNRGEQLQEHEIIKGLLLGKLHEHKLDGISSICAKIWDACSQFDTRIQKSFTTAIRTALFGDEADSLCLNGRSSDANFGEQNLKLLNSLSFNSSSLEEKTLFDILSPEQISPSSTENEAYKNDAVPKEESIIDFPNFLMHVLRLYYNDYYRRVLKDDSAFIPLSDKYLLYVYNVLKELISPLDFFLRLLYCRVIFDRFVIKSNSTEEDETREWILRKPYKEDNSLRYKNSFSEEEYQHAIIQAISCLQVSFRTKLYKNFLQEILSWFVDKPSMNEKEYLTKLHQLMLKEFDRTSADYIGICESDNDDKHQGTNVPHYLFNFTDYLYWWFREHNKEIIWDTTNDIKIQALQREIEYIKKIDFRFLNRNSIEHHYPQKRKEEINNEGVTKYLLNCLGNLILISKSANSRLSDKNPIDKAALYNGRTDLPPTRQIIYHITRSEGWTGEQIENHRVCVETLLNLREKILMRES